MPRAAASFAVCKTDWSKARANYGSWVRDEFPLDLINLRIAFLAALKLGADAPKTKANCEKAKDMKWDDAKKACVKK